MSAQPLYIGVAAFARSLPTPQRWVFGAIIRVGRSKPRSPRNRMLGAVGTFHFRVVKHVVKPVRDKGQNKFNC